VASSRRPPRPYERWLFSKIFLAEFFDEVVSPYPWRTATLACLRERRATLTAQLEQACVPGSASP
jgi:hypothetical protein